MTLFISLVLISSISFLYYGTATIFNKAMQVEFERYGLNKFRALTGYLQLLGGIGLLVGLKIAPILSISSAGLSLLMLMGFVVRVKIKDSVLLSAPSFLFMLLNAYIFWASIKVL
jgi:uncharacterized membrane protein YphA (DoxX/SURF4 family)